MCGDWQYHRILHVSPTHHSLWWNKHSAEHWSTLVHLLFCRPLSIFPPFLSLTPWVTHRHTHNPLFAVLWDCLVAWGSWHVSVGAGVHIPCGIFCCPLGIHSLNLQVPLLEKALWHMLPSTLSLCLTWTHRLQKYTNNDQFLSGQSPRLFLLMQLMGSADRQQQSSLWPEQHCVWQIWHETRMKCLWRRH